MTSTNRVLTQAERELAASRIGDDANDPSIVKVRDAIRTGKLDSVVLQRPELLAQFPNSNLMIPLMDMSPRDGVLSGEACLYVRDQMNNEKRRYMFAELVRGQQNPLRSGLAAASDKDRLFQELDTFKHEVLHPKLQTNSGELVFIVTPESYPPCSKRLDQLDEVILPTGHQSLPTLTSFRSQLTTFASTLITMERFSSFKLWPSSCLIAVRPVQLSKTATDQSPG